MPLYPPTFTLLKSIVPGGRPPVIPLSGYGRTIGLQPSSTLLDPATTAWVGAVVGNGGTVSGGRQTLVDTMIKGLKSDGVWAKLDRLWILAAENSQSALTDMVADILATVNNAPTFTTDRGYTGNGSNANIDTGFNATSGSPHFTQNSSSIFAWNNTSGADGASAFRSIIGNANGETQIIPNDNGSTYYCCTSTGNKVVTAPGTITGLLTLSRTASTTTTAYQNNSSFDSDATASGAPSATTIKMLGGPLGAFSNRQICAGGIGGSLSLTDVSNLYSRLRTYMTAVGVP